MHRDAARPPLVSIIALNYNQLPVTLEFLESTKTLTYPRYEILVVDNASDVDPTDAIRQRFPDVKTLRSDSNRGFTGGNNLGLAAARGDYVLFINNDTSVTPDLLERMLEPFEQFSDVGLVSPKIRYFDPPDLIQYAGATEINPWTGRNRTLGLGEIDHGQHDVGGFTGYAHGAAMLVSRKVLNEVGSLADVFFIYYEELDWSARIRRANYRIYYQPKALIYHKESVTMGPASAIKAYYHTRNRILFMRRNSRPLEFGAFLLFAACVVIPKQLLIHTLRGEIAHLRAVLRAVAWNLQFSPGAST